MVEQKHYPKRKRLVILLLLLVIVVISGVLLWQANKSSPEQTNDQPTSADQLTPAGYTEFKDTTVGFRLAYPKDWGKPYAAHLVARDLNGNELGPLYRWRFENKPNVYIFAPRLPGAVAVPASGPTSFYSGYSYDFTKQSDNSYCILYTRSRSDRPDCNTKETPFIKSYTYNNVRSLIRNYYASRSTTLDGAFFAPNDLVSNPGAETSLQEVELLSVLDNQALYPSVSIEIIDHQGADMSSYLDQVKTIAQTVQVAK